MNLLIIIIIAWLAGLAAFAGGGFSAYEGSAETPIKKDIIHGIVAFGGGVLVAAIAFALAPDAIENLSTVSLLSTFIAGGLVFCVIDLAISKSQGSKAQFLAMLLDFIPEAMAMGALFSKSTKSGILLALFIGVQNFPEGFNTHRENSANGISNKSSLKSLALVSFLGPISACCGYLYLQDHEILTASVMSFASGGILYLVFQDIAPQAKLQRHWTPSLGAVLGFSIGMMGEKLLG